MIQNSKEQKNITMSIQLLTLSCLKRVKTNEIGVKSIEASPRFFNPLAGLQPLVTCFRVVGV